MKICLKSGNQMFIKSRMGKQSVPHPCKKYCMRLRIYKLLMDSTPLNLKNTMPSERS
jgi:hypothetical protein